MFNGYHKCKEDMGTDHSGDCSKPKKSKTSKCEDSLSVLNWAHLPSVVLYEIFDLLDKKDRQNAASVCKNWRQNLFHPKWWQRVTFEIQPLNLDRAKFCTSVFGRIVTSAKIRVNTLYPDCTEEFILLLETLTENNHLRELIIEPSHCHFDVLPYRNNDENFESIIRTLELCLLSLKKFSFGCIEDFSHCLNKYLEVMARKYPQQVTHLGFASVKDVPDDYELSCFDPGLITPFVNLKVLSIDYDQLSDDFLIRLEKVKDLERLIVHLHTVRKYHPSTSNKAWINFKKHHPQCELRLTVIHSYKAIKTLHKRVLRKEMPLTHLKVFFCEMVNSDVLEYLSVNYAETLKSVIWVDSFSNTNRSWVFIKEFDESPDPLIMVSWLCKNLEEVVLYGYKYFEENLIAIARLRGDKLKKFEVAEEDVLFPRDYGPLREDFLIDIPLHIKKPWAPVKTADLHPVICSPMSGDSDEYLLPLVLADLH